MVCDDHSGINLSGWKALAPAQRNALTSQLVRRAHAARNRLIGKVLLEAVGQLFGWTAPAHIAAAVPASARARDRLGPAQG